MHKSYFSSWIPVARCSLDCRQLCIPTTSNTIPVTSWPCPCRLLLQHILPVMSSLWESSSYIVHLACHLSVIAIDQKRTLKFHVEANINYIIVGMHYWLDNNWETIHMNTNLIGAAVLFSCHPYIMGYAWVTITCELFYVRFWQCNQILKQFCKVCLFQ